MDKFVRFLTAEVGLILPYLWPSQGNRHGVFIPSLINLSKTFLRKSLARKTSQTWIFARLFECSSYFISLILDFICLMVLMIVWQWKSAIGKIFKESRNLNWNFQIGRGLIIEEGEEARGQSELKSHFICSNYKLYVVSILALSFHGIRP